MLLYTSTVEDVGEKDCRLDRLDQASFGLWQVLTVSTSFMDFRPQFQIDWILERNRLGMSRLVKIEQQPHHDHRRHHHHHNNHRHHHRHHYHHHQKSDLLILYKC